MNVARAIILKLLSTLAFTVMSACVKLIGAAHPGEAISYPVGQTVFCRSLFALIPVFIWLGVRGDLASAWQTDNRIGHVRRGIVGSSGMFCGFTALILLPLADATAISYAAPMFTVVLAAVILKEEIRGYRWSAVLVGFAGVLVMLWPYIGGLAGGTGPKAGDLLLVGAFFGLAGAVFSGFATIATRQLTMTETTGAIVFHFMVFTTLLGFLTLPLSLLIPQLAWRWPDFYDASLLILMGVAGGIGQITLTQSYKHGDASLIAPFDYVSMIWAILIGWFIFAELPKPAVVAGGAIVIAAGVFVILRERQLGIDRRRQKESSPTRAL
jgi:drug/metabolite transporter (DMT)-like permease